MTSSITFEFTNGKLNYNCLSCNTDIVINEEDYDDGDELCESDEYCNKCWKNKLIQKQIADGWIKCEICNVYTPPKKSKKNKYNYMVESTAYERVDLFTTAETGKKTKHLVDKIKKMYNIKSIYIQQPNVKCCYKCSISTLFTNYYFKKNLDKNLIGSPEDLVIEEYDNIKFFIDIKKPKTNGFSGFSNLTF